MTERRREILRHPLVRMILWCLKIAIAVGVGFGLLIFFVQSSMIYYPTLYAPGEVERFADNSVVVPIRFATSEGQQEAYWFTADEVDAASLPQPALPNRIWLVFSGNASRALDWVDVLEPYQGRSAGFLLIDYPGYGASAGSPSPGSTLEATTGAVAALASQFQWDETKLVRPRLAMLGQSLGAAAALQAATHYDSNRLVLISPFTSMLAMARRTVGPVYCHVLRHRWDNIARLEELAEQVDSPSSPAPHITVFHGDADRIIPIEMSRTLAAEFPKFVSLVELPGLSHNDITWDTSGAAPIIEELAR